MNFYTTRKDNIDVHAVSERISDPSFILMISPNCLSIHQRFFLFIP